MDRDLLEFLAHVGAESHVIDMGLNEQTGEHEWLKAPRPGKGVCDFCSSTPVVCVFEAGTIRMLTPDGLPDFGSKDPWGACADCKPLIEKGKRGALVDRCAPPLAKKWGMSIGFARQAVMQVQSAFWKAREGNK